jgi:arylsulfatase A-like enzyme
VVAAAGWAAAAAPVTAAPAESARPTNIVLVYADDVGYGDLGCYGATKVPTPNLDRLAKEGLRFTDAHSPAATCTPSRYAMMTGEYAWRKKGTAILPGDATLIVDPARMTLPRLLKDAGYETGIVGKWHLGLGATTPDWNGEIKPGPIEVGFNSSFIIPATGDRVPCVFVEGHRVAGLDPSDPIKVQYGRKVGDEPTGAERPDLLKLKPSHGHADTIVNGVSRIGFMTGGKAARWVDEDIADVLTKRAVAFIEQNKARPFFLYLPTHDVHVPRLPNARFVGKSGTGIRGDALVELDWTVGQVMGALDEEGLADNTLFIFASDNGPVVDDGYADGAEENLNGHTPAGDLRGKKSTPFEAGTRTPMIVRWPARVKPGAVSGALVCHVDFLSSFAALVGKAPPGDAGRDSANVLPALLGESRAGRDRLVEHGSQRSALRQGQWKMVFHNSRFNPPADPAPATAPAGQELFDLASDPAEQRNLAKDKPDVVAAMMQLLERVKAGGDRDAAAK